MSVMFKFIVINKNDVSAVHVDMHHSTHLELRGPILLVNEQRDRVRAMETVVAPHSALRSAPRRRGRDAFVAVSVDGPERSDACENFSPQRLAAGETRTSRGTYKLHRRRRQW
jgi:hypothetical protein